MKTQLVRNIGPSLDWINHIKYIHCVLSRLQENNPTVKQIEDHLLHLTYKEKKNTHKGFGA